MRLPIRVRMTAWYVALLALIIAGVGAFLALRLHADLVAGTDGRLALAVDQIALGYHEEGSLEVGDVSSTVLSGEGAASQVLTPARRVVVHYGDPVARRPLLSSRELRAVLAGERLQRTARFASERLRIVARATTRGGRPQAVVAGQSMATIDDSVQRLVVLLLLACPAALAATALGGWWLARRALRPIDRLTTDAARIGIDRLSERLPVSAARDEVANLATTLNTMLGRIETGVEEQRRLIADAAHELRTPLAAMRAELGVSLHADDLGPEAQAVLRSTVEEVDRLSAIVDALLTLASADRGALELELRPVDVAAVAEETLDRLRPLADWREVTIDARLSHAPARGDPAWLAQAIGNLLDNAIKFGPAGGTVTLTVAAQAGEARVQVLDEGPGIPADARELVFDRFRRLDPSRTRATGGSGLGLAIVREIVLVHGGRVWAEAGPAGGSLFTLTLPAEVASERTLADSTSS